MGVEADYFKVGDEVLYGKYKNKRGKVVGWGKDKHGNPTIEIEPISSNKKDGRKKKKKQTIGLYRIWRADIKKNKKPIDEAQIRVDNAGFAHDDEGGGMWFVGPEHAGQSYESQPSKEPSPPPPAGPDEAFFSKLNFAMTRSPGNKLLQSIAGAIRSGKQPTPDQRMSASRIFRSLNLEQAQYPTLKEAYLDEGQPRTPRGPFKIGQFRNLKSLRERVQYLKTRTDTKLVGEGSSRVVFLVEDGKRVLKVSKYQRGKAQNRTEAQAVSAPNSRTYLPKMFAKAADYSWILVEGVDPINSAREFEQRAAIPLKYVEIGIDFLSPEIHNRKPSDRTYQKYKQVHDTLSKKNPWYGGLIRMAQSANLVAGDIGKWDSWGITKRGRLVLIDYGLTEEVWNQYYERPG